MKKKTIFRKPTLNYSDDGAFPKY